VVTLVALISVGCDSNAHHCTWGSYDFICNGSLSGQLWQTAPVYWAARPYYEWTSSIHRSADSNR